MLYKSKVFHVDAIFVTAKDQQNDFEEVKEFLGANYISHTKEFIIYKSSPGSVTPLVAPTNSNFYFIRMYGENGIVSTRSEDNFNFSYEPAE